jgi:hypothetical protein
VLARGLARGERPVLVPTGGSSALGNVGFVAAAFELAEQVASGALPAPREIYVPVGSGGTLAGLMLGARLAGLDTRVVGVLVTDLLPPSPARLARLARATLSEKLGRPIPPAEHQALRRRLEDPAFDALAGTFVSLKLRNCLRGCIGCLHPIEPIRTGVRGNALNSAFHDPRFSSLTLRELDTATYYSYMLLYIAAYMLDDIIVLGTGVVLLSRHRLQEKEGRVLKLIAGVVMVGLGIYLLADL